MGSTVVYGRGKAVVTEIGMKTEMGKIANALTLAEEGKTPLQIKLGSAQQNADLDRLGHLRVHFRV